MPTLDKIQQDFPKRPTKRYINRVLKPALSSADCLNASFLSSDDNHDSVCYGCDIRKVVQFFGFLQNKCRGNRDLDRTVRQALQELISNLPKRPTSQEELRVYLMLPACHLMTDFKMYDSIACPFARSVKNLDGPYQQILDDWLKAIPLNHFRRIVEIFTDVVRRLAPKWMNYAGKSLNIFTSLESCLWLLDKIYKVNVRREEYLPSILSHMPELSANSQLVPYNWNPAQSQQESRILLNTFDQSLHWIMNTLDIIVDRRNLIEDTMMLLQPLQSQHDNIFKRKLVVRFKDENDYGPGVNREFFTLILQNLLSPSYGLFTYLDQGASAVWFHQKETDLHYFHFAGFMLGLALYHSQFVSLPFPTAVFKKLLGVQTDFNDLKEIRPDVARGLSLLLDTNQVENLEDLSFEVMQIKGGKITSVELCENGKNIPVTIDNRNDYVRLMVDFYLNKETAEEFDQFNKGFYQAFDYEILKLLRIKPFELRRIFIGHEEIDTRLLEINAVYEGGYNRNCQTIRIFWDIIHSLSQEDVKRFVWFVTGSERIPHSGLKIKIHPRPALDGERIQDVMPEAITCFEQLLLPNNPDKERLRERLFSAMGASPEFTNYFELLRRINARSVMRR